jgi:hypothetical protein
MLIWAWLTRAGIVAFAAVPAHQIAVAKSDSSKNIVRLKDTLAKRLFFKTISYGEWTIQNTIKRNNP